MKPLNLLREAGFSELAYQFAAYIGRQQQTEAPLVTLTAGLLSETISEGHVCLNLYQFNSPNPSIQSVLPEASSWRSSLHSSDVVGQPGEFKPLILTADGLLYLYRYWQSEQQVAQAILQRLNVSDVLPDNASLKNFMAEWQNDLPDIDWQKVAVLSALRHQFCVISGGPGTGKTTVVLKVLQCLQLLESSPRIALAAPTGKAAARLQQAISQHTGEQFVAKTLHRLLGISARFDQGRYSVDRPLPVDVLIVDEASMIDINLMAITLKALPLHARLILLGDSDQLASVESGAVLANLCADQPDFSAEFRSWVKQISDIDLPATHGANPLQDSLVKLQHSYRFAAGGQVGLLATAVNQGDADEVGQLLNNQAVSALRAPSPDHIHNQLLQGYQAYIHAVEKRANAESCIQAFEQFRMLCAVKNGAQSVYSVNQMMMHLLAKRGWRTAQPYYYGRPIMITQNHYRQNLFNGDIGMVLPNADGELQACFLFGGELRWLPLSRLPAHETVFAMTVHKSQGSEFEHIALLLPEEDSAVLSRELIYTALTRARQTVQILSTPAILQQAVQRRHQRESGLSKLLHNAGNV
ncbi:exodeoxyribonuclease V subunit alpha [Methylophaga pinxianii]|uniref:exodeoxyribonuclease V subunit alpha n=1 Tax=Methylophaga pinxianii TaxID=2881052 RepID=UPI001CF3E2BD|nr:exodeoxyribonuclease V subunit alpha [Methylophaga pinxianii]MCB2426471.1 exodeoxyribonuclease V subunit alpha [Methylophaga pinxianii]UPH46886.1 exodeoxyribonuclease V subunit alpha [Methylophaga pinxianii]